MKTKLSKEEIIEEKSKYTRKIEIPIYEPKDEKPHLSRLYDKTKTNQLKENIRQSNVPDDIKEFLYSAAERHTKFDYSKIADYYAHADLDTKKLFEESALVIIDYNDAIRNGFISYQKEVDFDLQEYLDSLTEEDLLRNLNNSKDKKKSKLPEEALKQLSSLF